MAPVYEITPFERWKRENAVAILETMAEFGCPTEEPNTRPGQPFAGFAAGIYFGTLRKDMRLAFYARVRQTVTPTDQTKGEQHA